MSVAAVGKFGRNNLFVYEASVREVFGKTHIHTEGDRGGEQEREKEGGRELVPYTVSRAKMEDKRLARGGEGFEEVGPKERLEVVKGAEPLVTAATPGVAAVPVFRTTESLVFFNCHQCESY